MSFSLLVHQVRRVHGTDSKFGADASGVATGPPRNFFPVSMPGRVCRGLLAHDQFISAQCLLGAIDDDDAVFRQFIVLDGVPNLFFLDRAVAAIRRGAQVQLRHVCVCVCGCVWDDVV